MRRVKVSPERFKEIRDEKGITAYALARLIDSSPSHMWRLTSGRYTTSYRFLDRMVPVLGLSGVADIIADEGQREAFVLWHIATHEAIRKTA
ncbi:helix-turn-helix transcriptional regulator [Nonomuraea sp. NPDC052129]|uniref:helix-turn-helix domain-containing protein n=1 Tax=Nonomuraea sp. NPDC052129 TaxID=3154651 RepID=UPI003427D20B